MAFDRQELVVAAVLIGIVALAVVSNKKENVKADGGDADVDEREAVRQDFEDQIAGNKQRRVEWCVAGEDFLQRAQSSRAPPTGSRLDKALTGLLQGAVDITNDLQTMLDAYHRVFSKSSHYIEIGDEITRETSEFLTLEHLLVELEKRWMAEQKEEAGSRPSKPIGLGQEVGTPNIPSQKAIEPHLHADGTPSAFQQHVNSFTSSVPALPASHQPLRITRPPDGFSAPQPDDTDMHDASAKSATLAGMDPSTLRDGNPGPNTVTIETVGEDLEMNKAVDEEQTMDAKKSVHPKRKKPGLPSGYDPTKTKFYREAGRARTIKQAGEKGFGPEKKKTSDVPIRPGADVPPTGFSQSPSQETVRIPPEMGKPQPSKLPKKVVIKPYFSEPSEALGGTKRKRVSRESRSRSGSSDFSIPPPGGNSQVMSLDVEPAAVPNIRPPETGYQGGAKRLKKKDGDPQILSAAEQQKKVMDAQALFLGAGITPQKQLAIAAPGQNSAPVVPVEIDLTGSPEPSDLPTLTHQSDNKMVIDNYYVKDAAKLTALLKDMEGFISRSSHPYGIWNEDTNGYGIFKAMKLVMMEFAYLGEPSGDMGGRVRRIFKNKGDDLQYYTAKLRRLKSQFAIMWNRGFSTIWKASSQGHGRKEGEWRQAQVDYLSSFPVFYYQNQYEPGTTTIWKERKEGKQILYTRWKLETIYVTRKEVPK